MAIFIGYVIIIEVVLLRKNIHIRFCTPGDLGRILLCQQFVIESLVQPTYYYPSTSTELEELLLCEHTDGFILGAYQEENLLGFVAVQKWVGPYYGYICCSSKECYSIEDTLVVEEHRGFGIQRLLWQTAFLYLPEFSEVLCTIHPDNNISLSNATRLGFMQCMMCHPYDSSPRIILRKAL